MAFEVQERGGITEGVTMEQGRQERTTDTRQGLTPGGMSTIGIFEDRESAVRSYCRTWPKIFDRAAGSWLYDEDGRAYLDFFTGPARSTTATTTRRSSGRFLTISSATG